MEGIFPPLAVIIPAAGIGKRMQADIPKQYLKLNDKTVIEHTIGRFIELPFVTKVIVVLAKEDELFATLGVSSHPKIVTIAGGRERADSVLQGVNTAQKMGLEWLMVHDAARPCVNDKDIVELYRQCLEQSCSGILAVKVRDTMKRALTGTSQIAQTVDRTDLWHALTPQCCPTSELQQALETQLEHGLVNSKVTDEASAIELNKGHVLLVAGSAKNLKITEPEDLALASLYIQSEGL